MATNKVTASALREMKDGQTVIFVLESPAKIHSGRNLLHRLQYELGCKFKTTADYKSCCLAVTKLAIN